MEAEGRLCVPTRHLYSFFLLAVMSSPPLGSSNDGQSTESTPPSIDAHPSDPFSTVNGAGRRIYDNDELEYPTPPRRDSSTPTEPGFFDHNSSYDPYGASPFFFLFLRIFLMAFQLRTTTTRTATLMPNATPPPQSPFMANGQRMPRRRLSANTPLLAHPMRIPRGRRTDTSRSPRRRLKTSFWTSHRSLDSNATQCGTW